MAAGYRSLEEIHPIIFDAPDDSDDLIPLQKRAH